MDISEKDFEATIETALLMPNGDYQKRLPDDYDRALCLDVRMLIQFIYATQPQEWEKLKTNLGAKAAEAREEFIRRLVKEVETRGTLDVLRKGVKGWGCKFDLAYFQPVSGLNEEHRKLYEANVLSVIRQLRYSEKDEKSLDLTLFLNGFPIITAELKNPLTGQTVQDAIWQYRHGRDPREPLFKFGRCLAHFAVDPDLVYMTTRLRGKDTEFLPFNKGNNDGAGNPPNPHGFKTAYLWEEVWRKDNLLEIIGHFLCEVDELDDGGRPTGKRSLIFPRYHQRDAVRRLVAHAKARGVGQHYLIQHSAGSGKSNTIAWLCHQLAGVHDAKDERVFDSIVVITDRVVLDRQLQQTIRQFEQTKGVVENIDKHSKQLKKALEEGKNIIVTTLQKFPVIVDEIQALAGQRFAVVVDEAHSSQSGESVKSLKQVLSAASLEDAEKEDVEETDLEDEIAADMKARGRLPHVSFFAFTATPKPKTLELFGTKQPDGTFRPFSEYTMRQAIEEGFILDVLDNYTTYHEYWNLLKTIEDDPKYDREKATYLLKSFVSLHEHAIRQKTELMVEHFHHHVRPKIGGKAKAMVVTRSRLHAVRYKLAFDEYIKEKGYNFKTLVAFSGTVRDPDTGLEYTQAQMNSTHDKKISEAQTAETFKQDEYRIIICANKFQTGFNEPLLHTMYVDKKLGGVNAVQTLSRLNRTSAGKDGTMVLDFANKAEEIQEAFQPY
jgi:type I restriction enzyme R subunit